MRRLFATFLALIASACLGAAAIPDTNPAWTNPPAAKPPASAATSPAGTRSAHIAANVQTPSQMQAALEQLTQTNHELLDLLKKQQAVLEDMQFDRRLQSRQIALVEERLEEALNEKHELQRKVDALETQAAIHPVVASVAPTSTAPTPATPNGTTAPPPKSVVIEDVRPTVPAPADDGADTPPPATYLPPEGGDHPPGDLRWHRILTLKGTDNQQSEVFLIRGKNWRVLWHNQDKSGKLYANTSALFINAFPRDDTIPQRVCSKLGSGGDAAVLPGPGNYYLKVEASGGSWEIAVEDLR